MHKALLHRVSGQQKGLQGVSADSWEVVRAAEYAQDLFLHTVEFSQHSAKATLVYLAVGQPKPYHAMRPDA